MKNLQAWLDEYSVSHQNPTNKKIHWVCIPLIFFSIVGIFYTVQLPVQITAGLHLNLSIVMLLFVWVYYFTLSRSLSVGMLLFSFFCIAGCYLIQQSGLPLWAVSIGIFVVAWAGQFYGHNVEGKKPSFFKDIQYLMIGPAWLMSFIYKKIGLNL